MGSLFRRLASLLGGFVVLVLVMVGLGGAAPERAGALSIYRQGGSATDWSINGTTNYGATLTRQQVGAVACGNGGSVVVTFPVAFQYAPIVVTGLQAGWDRTVVIDQVSATGVTFVCRDQAGNPANAVVMWTAIGPP